MRHSTALENLANAERSAENTKIGFKSSIILGAIAIVIAIGYKESPKFSSTYTVDCESPKWIASTAGTVTNYQPKVRLVVNSDTLDLLVRTDGKIRMNGQTHYYTGDWHSRDEDLSKAQFVQNGSKLISTTESIEDVQNPSIGNKYWYKRQTIKTIEYDTATNFMTQKTSYKNYGGPSGKVYEEFFKIEAICK